MLLWHGFNDPYTSISIILYITKECAVLLTFIPSRLCKEQSPIVFSEMGTVTQSLSLLKIK